MGPRRPPHIPQGASIARNRARYFLRWFPLWFRGLYFEMRISPHLCYNDPRPLGRQSHNRAVLFLYGRLQGSAMPKEETAGANPQLCGGMSCSMATLLQLVSSYFWQFSPVGSVCVVDYLGIAARCRELAGVICAWQFKDAAVFRDSVLRYISAVVGV